MQRDPEPGPDDEGPRRVTYDLGPVEVDTDVDCLTTSLSLASVGKQPGNIQDRASLVSCSLTGALGH